MIILKEFSNKRYKNVCQIIRIESTERIHVRLVSDYCCQWPIKVDTNRIVYDWTPYSYERKLVNQAFNWLQESGLK